MKNSANSSNVEGMSKVGYFESPASGNFNTRRMQRNSRVTPAKVNNAKPCCFCENIEMSKQKRLAWGKQCQTCNSRNQLARVYKKSDRAHQVDVGETDTDSDTTMSLEAEHASRYAKETFTKMIHGDEITFQTDCGKNTTYLEWRKCHACRLDTCDDIQPQKSEEIFDQICSGGAYALMKARAAQPMKFINVKSTNFVPVLPKKPLHRKVHQLTPAENII